MEHFGFLSLSDHQHHYGVRFHKNEHKTAMLVLISNMSDFIPLKLDKNTKQHREHKQQSDRNHNSD